MDIPILKYVLTKLVTNHAVEQIIYYILPDLIEGHILKLLKNSKYHNKSHKFIDLLRESDAILSGSFLLFMLGFIDEYNDVDIYVNIATAGSDVIVCSDIAFGMLDKYQVRMSDLYDNINQIVYPMRDYYIQNGLSPIYYEPEYRYSFGLPYEPQSNSNIGYWNQHVSKYLHTIREYNLNSSKIQLLETRCDPRTIIGMFDFDFCKLFYSFKDREITYLNEYACVNKVHKGPIDELKTSDGRKEKYLRRGYRFI